MGTTTNTIQEHFRVTAGTNLASVVLQVDALAEIVSRELGADLIAMFYRSAPHHRCVPIAYHTPHDGAEIDLLALEKHATDLTLGEDTSYGSVAEVPDSAVPAPGDSHALRYAGRYQHRIGDSAQVMIAAYWRKKPEHDKPMDSALLPLVSRAIGGAMSQLNRMRGIHDFSMRLADLIHVFEIDLIEFRVRELVSQMLHHFRAVVPVSGLCLLAYDRRTDAWGVSEFFANHSAPPDFAGRLTEVVAYRFGDSPPAFEPQRRSYEITDEMADACGEAVAEELLPEPHSRYVLVIWSRPSARLSLNDRELARLFALMAQTVLRNAQAFRELIKSHHTLERTSTRMANFEALAALTDMTSGVAHDINNIIGGILGRVQLLRAKVDDQNVRRGLAVVEELALEGADTIKCIQEFSTSARYKQLEPTDLAGLVQRVLADTTQPWRCLADQKRISVKPVLEPGEFTIDASPEALATLLSKVLENAVEFSSNGAEIAVALYAEGGLIRLSVSDHGPGIDPSIQEKIFFPFFSTKKGVRGAGLGLAIVHGIAVRHSAQVRVHSRPGQGTTVETVFTRRSRHRDHSDVSRRGRPRGDLAILVVDDDRQIREILSDMLVIDGHRATACCDAYEALEALDQSCYDLMITDLGMPGMSGLDLAGVAHDKHPDMPIAMITGWGTQLDEKETALKGIRIVLAKPFHLADVKRMIRALVSV